MQAWFVGRLARRVVQGAPEVTIDRDEILVVGMIAEPSAAGESSETAEPASRAMDDPRCPGRRKPRGSAVPGRLVPRGDPREADGDRPGGRDAVGPEGVLGSPLREDEVLFSTASVPVMTRLRSSERAVLDTLIDAGVARSRSDALAWCVRLVNRHQEEWIEQLPFRRIGRRRG